MNPNLRSPAFLAAALFTAVAAFAQPTGLDVNVRSNLEPPPKIDNGYTGSVWAVVVPILVRVECGVAIDRTWRRLSNPRRH